MSQLSQDVLIDIRGLKTQFFLDEGTVKAVDGVDFTISPVPAGETATKTATSAAPTVGWDGLISGTTYTITEENLVGYVNGSIDCDGDNVFTPAAGENVTCAVTNSGLASVDVTKTVDGTSTDWNSEFTNQSRPGR